jgi:hypothetical protein
MSHDLALADDLAAILGDEHERDGLPCETLARRVHRRTADVLAVLRADSRFACSGTTRNRRWHARVGAREGMGRNLPPDPDSVPMSNLAGSEKRRRA